MGPVKLLRCRFNLSRNIGYELGNGPFNIFLVNLNSSMLMGILLYMVHPTYFGVIQT
eukprot:UN19816